MTRSGDGGGRHVASRPCRGRAAPAAGCRWEEGGETRGEERGTSIYIVIQSLPTPPRSFSFASWRPDRRPQPCTPLPPMAAARGKGRPPTDGTAAPLTTPPPPRHPCNFPRGLSPPRPPPPRPWPTSAGAPGRQGSAPTAGGRVCQAAGQGVWGEGGVSGSTTAAPPATPPTKAAANTLTGGGHGRGGGVHGRPAWPPPPPPATPRGLWAWKRSGGD